MAIEKPTVYLRVTEKGFKLSGPALGEKTTFVGSRAKLQALLEGTHDKDFVGAGKMVKDQ